MKQVAYHDEMTPHVCRAVQEMLIGAPQVSHVVCLQDQDDDPVNAGHHRVQAEAGLHVIVLSPYGMALVIVLALLRSLNCVIHSNNHHQEPCYDCEDLVGREVGFRELRPFGERVVYSSVSLRKSAVGGS